MPLIKEAQLGNSHATGSNPAGDEHGTKAGFRDRTRAATANGLAVHKTGEKQCGCSHHGLVGIQARQGVGATPAGQWHEG
jgi:hypothetical protein